MTSAQMPAGNLFTFVRMELSSVLNLASSFAQEAGNAALSMPDHLGSVRFRTPKDVVTAADSVLPAIVAYGRQGRSDSLPAGMRHLLTLIDRRARSAAAVLPFPADGGPAVPPLLSFVRHQKSPYNDLCPYYIDDDGQPSTTRCVSGCVATALEEVSISEDWPDGGRRRTIKAARAEYLDGEWWLYRPVSFYFSQTGEDVPSPTPALEEIDFRAFPGLDEKPCDFIIQNKDPAYYSTGERRRFLSTHPNMSAKFRREMEYDLWAQMMAPFACIVITLFAIPAGVATGRQSVFKGIVGALAMFFAFYALTIGCLVMARLGFMPAVIAALLPDVVFLGIGSYLFYRQR